jgi:hypothetical protein
MSTSNKNQPNYSRIKTPGNRIIFDYYNVETIIYGTPVMSG